MAQTQAVPTEGMTEMCTFIATAAGASEIDSVCLLKTACTADKDQTSGGVTKATESGCTLVSADSTAASDLVITQYHTFTAGAAATIKGCGAWNQDDDVLMGIVCYAADVVLETSDTLKNTFTWTMTDTTA